MSQDKLQESALRTVSRVACYSPVSCFSVCFPTHTVILGLVPSPPPPTPQDCQTKSILLVRFPYGVGMMSSQPSAPVQYTGQPTGPGGQVRPLFPSAQPGTPSPGPPASRATFPAYSSESEPEKKPQLIASTGSSSKIIHPPEDISLVSTDWSAQTPPLEVRVEALGVLIRERASRTSSLTSVGSVWVLQLRAEELTECLPAGGDASLHAAVQGGPGCQWSPGQYWRSRGGGQLRPDDDAPHGRHDGSPTVHGGRRLAAAAAAAATAATATAATAQTRPGAGHCRPAWAAYAAAGWSPSLHGTARPRESASGMAPTSSSSSPALGGGQTSVLGLSFPFLFCFVCYLLLVYQSRGLEDQHNTFYKDFQAFENIFLFLF